MKKVFSCFVVLILLGCAEIAYKTATTKDTSIAYEQFLSMYPDGEYADKARKRIVELAFYEAQKENTAQAYEAFLKQYPESDPAPKAREKLETFAFENAQKNDDVTDYQKFLKKHPRSNLAPKVKEKLEAFDFKNAQKDDTVAAYQAFLKKYPKGSLAPKAKEKIEAFDFENAQKDDTPEAYERFLSKYPNGLNASNAKKIIKAKESGFWLTESNQDLLDLAVIWIDGWEKGVRIKSIDDKMINLQNSRWIYLEPGPHTILAAYDQRSWSGENASLEQLKSDSIQSDIDYCSPEISMRAKFERGNIYIIKHIRQQPNETAGDGKEGNLLETGEQVIPFAVRIGSINDFNDFLEIQGKKYLPKEWVELKESNRSKGTIILFKDDIIN